MAQSVSTLEERLRSVSSNLCASLKDALQSALSARGADVAQGLRPVMLTHNLGLDKSLASRVVRSIGADDAIRALHGIPTPQGLALIAGAVREAEGDEGLVAQLEAATAAYAELLGEFSGGRTDLEATLAGWIPEQRERAERDARRSVFRGMTTLSGTRTSAVYNALYLFPSEDPARLDSLVVVVRQDLRRLRAGARLQVARFAAEESGHRRLTLDGSTEVEDPRALLLEDLCSHEPPRLDLQNSDEGLLLAVDPQALDVNEFCTIGLGWRTPGHYPRALDAKGQPSLMMMTTSHPTEALVADLFIHKDVELGRTPWAVITKDHDLYPARTILPEDAPTDASCVAEWRPLEDLSNHPSGLNSPTVRSCPAIAETACREAGLSIGDFQCFRSSVAFPTPTESQTLCWVPVSR